VSRRPRRTRPAILASALLLGLAACSAPEPTPLPPVTSATASAAPTPTFTDVSHGDTDSIVKLRKYDPRARAAVVEPTVFLDGPAFCEAFHLPGTDQRCELAWVTEDSRLKVTLPVDPDAELLTVRDGEAGCIDERTGAGSCPWRAAEVTRRAGPDVDLLARVTTEDGTVTRIAELYLP
jgi:hypothetical protein